MFGRTPEKLATISDQFGFATSTDLDAVITDPSVDLVDICLPTRLHADIAVRAMQAGKDVLIELPLATTIDDAHRIVAAQQATGRRAFVDMFSRFSPANQHLRQAVADQRYGPLTVLEIEGRTALLWEGYDLTLQTLALDMMHADFDLITSLLGRPDTIHVTGRDGPTGPRFDRRGRARLPARHRPMHQLIADAQALRHARRLPRHLPRRGAGIHHRGRLHRARPQQPDRVHHRAKSGPSSCPTPAPTRR